MTDCTINLPSLLFLDGSQRFNLKMVNIIDADDTNNYKYCNDNDDIATAAFTSTVTVTVTVTVTNT